MVKFLGFGTEPKKKKQVGRERIDMTVNQGKLRDLYRGFNTLFNKGYEDVEAEYTKIAMIVPSSSRDETYAWLGQRSAKK